MSTLLNGASKVQITKSLSFISVSISSSFSIFLFIVLMLFLYVFILFFKHSVLSLFYHKPVVLLSLTLLPYHNTDTIILQKILLFILFARNTRFFALKKEQVNAPYYFNDFLLILYANPKPKNNTLIPKRYT